MKCGNMIKNIILVYLCFEFGVKLDLDLAGIKHKFCFMVG